jgi:hypothetical protein
MAWGILSGTVWMQADASTSVVCVWTRYDGIATHVGPNDPRNGWQYPWAEVLENRLTGRAVRGSIPDGATIEDFPNPVALRLAMDDHSVLGKWVYIRALNAEGRIAAFRVLDAMAAELVNPAFKGRIADLTPDAMRYLNGGTLAGGLRIALYVPRCDG